MNKEVIAIALLIIILAFVVYFATSIIETLCSDYYWLYSKLMLWRNRKERINGFQGAVYILERNALAFEGVKPALISKFIGLQIGEFILLPDSLSEVRPNDLRIIGPKTVLLIQGGPSLLIRLYQEGLSYRTFEDQLSEEDKIILRILASELSGWIWPEVGQVLLSRIKELGEDQVLLAIERLFDGVDRAMRKRQIPFIGSRLVS